MARPVFRDLEQQRQFDRDGYIHLRGFLSPEDVAALKQAYFDTLPESGGALTSDEADFKSKSEITYDFTFIDRNWEYKQKVFDIIAAAFAPKYAPILKDYRPIIANFIHKGHGGGEVPLHQNWAFVDEIAYTSVSVWVPLVDSRRANGTLEIAPGSHKRFGRFRGPMVPWELEQVKGDIIANSLVPMEASAGDAVILDDSVVHYSNVNTTDGLRLTIQLILVPSEAHCLHYHLDRQSDPNEVRVLEVDRDFFMKFHPWKRPEGKEIGRHRVNLRMIDIGEWRTRLSGPEFDKVRAVQEEPLPEVVSPATGATAPEAEAVGAPVEESGFLARIKRLFS